MGNDTFVIEKSKKIIQMLEKSTRKKWRKKSKQKIWKWSKELKNEK